jgi:VWFA-related protein
MARTLALAIAGVVLAGWAIRPSAQSVDLPPQLTILTPLPKAYVSGRVTLSARLDPPEAASAVIFFVDGRQVCVVPTPPFECDWEAGRSILEHQVRAVATLNAGGRVVQTVRTQGVSVDENVDVDVVQVTVTVTDKNGRFIRDLPRSAFHVYEDGRPQRISHFDSEDVPLDLIVGIDISGSMTPAMSRLKTAVKEFLAVLPQNNSVTLLGFNDTVFTLLRRATSPAERVRAVDRLAPWGSTALYDVIIRGVDMLGRQAGRKALIVFTDGEDQGSHATITDVERRLQASDVSLYMIGQGRGVTMDYLRAIMQRLTVPTGGRALFTDSINALHGAFGELLEELSNQYLLGYPREDTRRDDVWRKIRVDVDGYSEVRARQGYRVVAQP